MSEEDEALDVGYPKFDHGETLDVVVRPDEWVEFASDLPEGYLKADNAVLLRDMV